MSERHASHPWCKSEVATAPRKGCEATNRSFWLSIACSLDSVQLRIRSALRHEFVMRAGFDDAGAVQHDDPVRHADCAEAMRDQDGNPSVGTIAASGGCVSLE